MAKKGNIIIRDLIEINKEYSENLREKCLSLSESTFNDIFTIIESNRIVSSVDKYVTFSTSYIPVVDNHQNRNLLYLVKLEELTRYFEVFAND